MKLQHFLKEKNILRSVKNILLVILGTAILAFGTAVFMIPYDLVAGGISGIAIVIDMLIPESLGFITVDIIITVLTWFLFLLGLITLGRSFALKTLVSAIVYPPCITLFMKLVSPDVLGGYFYLEGGEYQEIAFIIAATVGGVLVGLGCAVAFLGGGSTGGVDVFAFIICKLFPKLKSSKVIFIIDASIVVLGIFVVKDIVVSILGILCALVGALLIDKVFLGGREAFIAHIVSDKYEEINRLIIERIERTTTIFDVVGGYSGETKKMLMLSFTMSQYNEILNIINITDKYAFVTVHKAHEINGEGWTR